MFRRRTLAEGRALARVNRLSSSETVDAESKIGSGFGASGTPTFFVNGRRLSGAHPYDKFKELVDEEIPKAKAKLASGTPRASLYDEIVGLK
jgi:predicted DsbA family dithiol-disulfide isomerase